MGQYVTVKPLGAGRAVGRRRNIASDGISANAFVDDGMADSVLECQSLRHNIFPAIMPIEGCARPIGNGIAEGDDRSRRRRHPSIDGL